MLNATLLLWFQDRTLIECIMKKISYLLLLIACIFLNLGCAAIKGQPDSPINSKEDLKTLKIYFEEQTITNCRQETDIIKIRICRDNIVDGRIRAINIHFENFEKNLAKEGITSGILTDWAVLGLNSAATIVGGPVVPALTMTSAGIIGAKGVFDKNAYFEKSMPIILTRMRAERKKVLAIIREGLAKININEYPLDRALDDVGIYNEVGSIRGALFAIMQDAGLVSKEADKKIEIAFKSRPPENLTPERQNRIDALLSKVDALSDSQTFSLNSNPPVPDDATLEKTILLRDPKNRRQINSAIAKQIIKMRLVYSQRDDSQLNSWEAAIASSK